MVLINGEKGKYISSYLKANLDIAKREILNDFDVIVVIDGQERAGKSELAAQMASYCDPSFNLERMCMTPEEFIRAVKKATRYNAVVFDEAFTGLLSRSAMSKTNKAIVQMMAEIGQKNLFIFIVMPNYFMLDSYMALHRSIALCHVYVNKEGDKWKRGQFAWYDSQRKKQLYLFGKKSLSYSPSICKPNFTTDFGKWLPFNEQAYRKKKLNSLMRKQTEDTDKELALEVEKQLWIRLMESDLPLTHEIKMKLLNMQSSSYYYKLKNYKEEIIKDDDSVV